MSLVLTQKGARMQTGSLLPELVLIALLAATLFHAVRLERALGVLRRDRAALEQMVVGFNDATRAAEAGVERLRGAAEGAGRDLAEQLQRAQSLREDIAFLSERGEKIADRLEASMRAGRPQTEPPERAIIGRGETMPRSQAERDLLRVMRAVRA